MRAIFLTFLLLLSAPAVAGPFLISDQWPDPASQPDTCTAKETGKPDVPLALIGTAQKSIRADMASVVGAHTWVITCSNAWGASDPVNFTFVAGKPAAPTGIRLVP